MRRKQRRRRPVLAQTIVEFALITLPFFAIFFAIIDYAQIYFYKNSLQNALRESTRFATAGRIIQETIAGVPQYTTTNGVTIPLAIPGDGHAVASRNECIRFWFQSNCVIRVPMTNITIVSAPTIGEDPPHVTTNTYGYLELLQTNGATANPGPGQAGDYVQVSAIYHLNTITPLFNYLGGYSRDGSGYPVYVSAIVKNEPALLNFTHIAIYADEP